MGLKIFWGFLGAVEGVCAFLGSQRCLICAFNNHGTWSLPEGRVRLLTEDFTRSLTGEEVGGDIRFHLEL